MAKMIDIQTVVEEIQSSLDIASYSEHDKGFDDGLEYVLDLIEKAPTLTPPNEWVSVEDDVPNPGERVLATDGIFVGEAYRSSANSWHRHTGFPWRDGVTGRTVKYWMLLPAPPAKEDQK